MAFLCDPPSMGTRSCCQLKLRAAMSNSVPVDRLRFALDPKRLVATAVSLVEVPSPTGSAGDVSDRLQSILEADGFTVERPAAGYEKAPAVVCRFDSGAPGPVVQFNGHLDTVHLPFVPPRVDNGRLYGSGASDMKGGIAAAVEALRMLRETGLLTAGSILLTGHDLHEAPWGDGTQVDGLIDAGHVGDVVLLPEYNADILPVIGRGQAVLQATITRAGEPVHEVLGGIEQPNVINAGAMLISRLAEWDQEVSVRTHPVAGRESVFVGHATGGQMFNQSPNRFFIEGTRRWLPGSDVAATRAQYLALCEEVALATGTTVEPVFQFVRDSFQLDPEDRFVAAFQSAIRTAGGTDLPTGVKPFVDDGNTFCSRAGIPAITHGPRATGAHTVNEVVPIAELERVAVVYALTALSYTSPDGPGEPDQPPVE